MLVDGWPFSTRGTSSKALVISRQYRVFLCQCFTCITNSFFDFLTLFFLKFAVRNCPIKHDWVLGVESLKKTWVCLFWWYGSWSSMLCLFPRQNFFIAGWHLFSAKSTGPLVILEVFILFIHFNTQIHKHTANQKEWQHLENFWFFSYYTYVVL